MSPDDDIISQRSRAMLDEIKRVFADVQRGRGVTLHETKVIDSYGSDEEREQARSRDIDKHWWEVPDEWISGFAGLTFLDEAGLRYYLPAFMSYWIRTGEEPFGLEDHLRTHDYRDFNRIFSLSEKRTIARFLDHVSFQFEGLGPGETLNAFWQRYFDAPVET